MKVTSSRIHFKVLKGPILKVCLEKNLARLVFTVFNMAFTCQMTELFSSNCLLQSYVENSTKDFLRIVTVIRSTAYIRPHRKAISLPSIEGQSGIRSIVLVH